MLHDEDIACKQVIADSFVGVASAGRDVSLKVSELAFLSVPEGQAGSCFEVSWATVISPAACWRWRSGFRGIGFHWCSDCQKGGRCARAMPHGGCSQAVPSPILPCFSRVSVLFCAGHRPNMPGPRSIQGGQKSLNPSDRSRSGARRVCERKAS